MDRRTMIQSILALGIPLPKALLKEDVADTPRAIDREVLFDFSTAKEKEAIALEKAAIVSVIAKWCCELNRFEWPKDWGESPNEFKRLEFVHWTGRWEKFNELGYGRIHEVLRSLIGEKECSRYWNVSYRKDSGAMTNEEFEEWWKFFLTT